MPPDSKPQVGRHSISRPPNCAGTAGPAPRSRDCSTAQAPPAEQATHHHKGNRKGGDKMDVPGQVVQVIFAKSGDQPELDMNGQSGGVGDQQELQVHQHPDRVGRAEQP
jgi:hypothetical protein